MAVGAVGKPDMTFEDWMEKNKAGQIKNTPQMRPGALTENGVPVSLAQDLHNGKTIFQVAAQNPTKETAGANVASSVGAGTQPSGVADSGTVNTVPSGDDASVQGASATGHTPQTQSPTLASGLRATQGNENADSQGGATSDSLNHDLYAQYEAAMKEIRIADETGEVPTGEGTLSTGGADGAGGPGDVNGPDGTNGVDGGVSTPPTGDVGGTDPTNSPPDNSGNNENPNDSSNDNTTNINRQEQRRQEEVLDTRRFHKLEDEAA